MKKEEQLQFPDNFPYQREHVDDVYQLLKYADDTIRYVNENKAAYSNHEEIVKRLEKVKSDTLTGALVDVEVSLHDQPRQNESDIRAAAYYWLNEKTYQQHKDQVCIAPEDRMSLDLDYFTERALKEQPRELYRYHHPSAPAPEKQKSLFEETHHERWLAAPPDQKQSVPQQELAGKDNPGYLFDEFESTLANHNRQRDPAIEPDLDADIELDTFE